MVKLTMIGSKLRWKFSSATGKLILSPKETENGEEPCCCGDCNDSDLIGTKLYFSACHGCERAKFGVYVSEYYVKNINLNTSYNNGGCGGGESRENVEITQEIIDNINVEKETHNGKNCCKIYVRLGCLSTDIDPPGQCHSGVAGLEAIDKDGNVVFNGIIGEATTPIYICPNQNSSSGSSSSFRVAPYLLQSPEPPTWTNIHEMPKTHDAVGSILRDLLLAKFFPGAIDVALTHNLISFITLVDANSAEWCEYQVNLIMVMLREAAELFNMPYDLRAAHIFFKRAVHIAKKNRRKNG